MIPLPPYSIIQTASYIRKAILCCLLVAGGIIFITAQDITDQENAMYIAEGTTVFVSNAPHEAADIKPAVQIKKKYTALRPRRSNSVTQKKPETVDVQTVDYHYRPWDGTLGLINSASQVFAVLTLAPNKSKSFFNLQDNGTAVSSSPTYNQEKHKFDIAGIALKHEKMLSVKSDRAPPIFKVISTFYLASGYGFDVARQIHLILL